VASSPGKLAGVAIHQFPFDLLIALDKRGLPLVERVRHVIRRRCWQGLEEPSPFHLAVNQLHVNPAEPGLVDHGAVILIKIQRPSMRSSARILRRR